MFKKKQIQNPLDAKSGWDYSDLPAHEYRALMSARYGLEVQESKTPVHLGCGFNSFNYYFSRSGFTVHAKFCLSLYERYNDVFLGVVEKVHAEIEEMEELRRIYQAAEDAMALNEELKGQSNAA